MPKPHQTQLEIDFLKLEKDFSHSQVALEALSKAAEVSCDFVN
jgi:hypothetical protein